MFFVLFKKFENKNLSVIKSIYSKYPKINMIKFKT